MFKFNIGHICPCSNKKKINKKLRIIYLGCLNCILNVSVFMQLNNQTGMETSIKSINALKVWEFYKYYNLQISALIIYMIVLVYLDCDIMARRDRFKVDSALYWPSGEYILCKVYTLHIRLYYCYRLVHFYKQNLNILAAI